MKCKASYRPVLPCLTKSLIMRRLLWVLLFLLLTQMTKAPCMTENIESKWWEVALRQMKESEFYASDFTPDRFYEALIFVEIQNPLIVFTQSVLETGWFTSESFLKYQNPFGMKEPVTRETLCKGTALGHGAFVHWYDAVKDYKLWQDYWLDTIYSPENYYIFLDTLPYAEAKYYTRMLKRIDPHVLLTVSDT